MYSTRHFYHASMWMCWVCADLICGWLRFRFEISFSASHEQTWAEMINTIKAVHLSTVPDRAVVQGGIMKSFSDGADETRWQNHSVWETPRSAFHLPSVPLLSLSSFNPTCIFLYFLLIVVTMEIWNRCCSHNSRMRPNTTVKSWFFFCGILFFLFSSFCLTFLQPCLLLQHGRKKTSCLNSFK